jgi:hypothetical protein
MTDPPPEFRWRIRCHKPFWRSGRVSSKPFTQRPFLD